MSYSHLRREHALKCEVFDDWFKYRNITWTQEEHNIDFILRVGHKPNPLLWAEAKIGFFDMTTMFTQLVLTLKKPYDSGYTLPPPWLACFDSNRINFVSFSDLLPIFTESDFDWSITPSDHKAKGFLKNREKLMKVIGLKLIPFNYEASGDDLKKFIKNNFHSQTDLYNRITVSKGNFVHIYRQWLEEVKPTIGVNWEELGKDGLLDADFYLADLLSENNKTLTDKLQVLLNTNYYKMNVGISKYTQKRIFEEVGFADEQKGHTLFWNKYIRPPKQEYHDYILNRRDLLVPSDLRERKGSFFTPKIWVERSQEYLAKTLGDDWQDNYVVWDCAAGTGNLLEGLVMPERNIYASTLDQADVDAMHQRIENGDLHLLKGNVFKFDFLNDPFTNLPPALKAIVEDPEKRKKLVVYINPPYADAGNKKAIYNEGEHKNGVSFTQTKLKYHNLIGRASDELFAQFLARIKGELKNCHPAEFSTLKTLQGGNSKQFRQFFKARLLNCFIVPADTFDNVKGQFPIGFKIWDTGIEEVFTHIEADVYNHKGEDIGKKIIRANDGEKTITQWITSYNGEKANFIGMMNIARPDFQSQNTVWIANTVDKAKTHSVDFFITAQNLIPVSIYLAVRKVIPATWLNDRDQFLYPSNGWQSDTEFQTNCLTYTLFNNSNNIKSRMGINHWIPFTETEIGVDSPFASTFMTDFISGRLATCKTDLFKDTPIEVGTADFSPEANAVFFAACEIYQYYHATAILDENYTVNASLYDIKAYFCGRNPQGRMNTKSEDKTYNDLITTLRLTLKYLAMEIEPKVWKYGFLK